MNFIFFSPHFPKNSTEFCFWLKEAGASVLGIGDAEYDLLDERLKSSLTEYYKISDLEDYDQVLRVLGYYGDAILYSSRIEDVFSRAMGNFAYQFRTNTYEEVKEIIDFIQHTK